MLNLSCEVCDNIQYISVDITPSIVGDNLNGYTALLRPRHTDYKKVGNEFYQGLELSTSHKDWDFRKFLQPEVMCDYALVKMLPSLADTFQTEEGRVFSAEEILPSYMLNTAMLGLLDPEEKWTKIYPQIAREICIWFGQEDKSRLLDICEKYMAENGRLIMRESILPYVTLVQRYPNRQVQNGINEIRHPDIGNISCQDEIIHSRKIYTNSV